MKEMSARAPEEEKPIETVKLPVPLQGHRGIWTGYSCLSMLLRNRGHDISAQAIFGHIFPEEDSELVGGPTLDTLALTTQEMVGEVPHIIDSEKHQVIAEQLKRRGLKNTPMDILKLYVRGEVPCMVRFLGYFVVVSGFDNFKSPQHNTIHLLNPASVGVEGDMRETDFERQWASEEPEYPGRNTRYLMMVLRPRKNSQGI